MEPYVLALATISVCSMARISLLAALRRSSSLSLSPGSPMVRTKIIQLREGEVGIRTNIIHVWSVDVTKETFTVVFVVCLQWVDQGDEYEPRCSLEYEKHIKNRLVRYKIILRKHEAFNYW